MTARKSCLVLLGLAAALSPGIYAADHNDPNQINAIFSAQDGSGFRPTKESGADIYDIFGWPADSNTRDNEHVILALTFAAVPKAGTLDPDLLYRMFVYPSPRDVFPAGDMANPEAYRKYIGALTRKFNTTKKSEVRVNLTADGKSARVSFLNFPGGNFTTLVPIDSKREVVQTSSGPIQIFVGGRDDAFFNDLPGFFRSINYAPQFYHVSVHGDLKERELPIPKSLLELEGNDLFNFTASDKDLGRTGTQDVRKRDKDIKGDLPTQGRDFTPARFKTDKDGNYRLVYTGEDAQKGKNVNAVILNIPFKFLTADTTSNRVVNVWTESMMIKASAKVDREEAASKGFFETLWAAIKSPFSSSPSRSVAEDVVDVRNYTRIDTDGQAFADATLAERRDEWQLGANNFELAPHFALRLAHLGWGFGPSIVALGLPTSFDFPVKKACQSDLKCLAGKYPVSQYVEYTDRNTGKDNLYIRRPDGKRVLALEDALLRVRRVFFQELKMPDNSWQRYGVNVPLRRTFQVFVPNVNAIDMDTNGTWPFGRRLEDQVATRFLALFLDMNGKVGNQPINVETLNQPELWHKAKIMPKVDGPNPQKNDTPFLVDLKTGLPSFPYLAEPWPENALSYRH